MNLDDARTLDDKLRGSFSLIETPFFFRYTAFVPQKLEIGNDSFLDAAIPDNHLDVGVALKPWDLENLRTSSGFSVDLIPGKELETLDASATDKPQEFTRYSTMENGFSRGNAEAEDEEKRFLGRRCAGRLWLRRRRRMNGPITWLLPANELNRTKTVTV